MKTFSTLCRGLYQPVLEKAWRDLSRDIEEITGKYAARGFPIPPGVMHLEIWERYKTDISFRAQIVFEYCCQAYNSSAQKPQKEEFSNEISSAIKTEQGRITAAAEHQFSEFNGRFGIPSFEIASKQYISELSSEGRRVANYFSAKATAFFGESQLEIARDQQRNRESDKWHQRPLGIVGISVLAALIGAMVLYLLRNHVGIAL